MMQNIIIKPNEDEYYKPEIIFNAEIGVCTIAGESYVQAVSTFYNPLILWLKEYTSDNSRSLEFNFKLSYYNTSSSKKYIEILKILQSFKEKGGNLTVNWYYNPEDPDVLEDAEDFMLISRLQFNLIQTDIL